MNISIARKGLYNTDLVTPVNQDNLADNEFGAGLFARPPVGRIKSRLVWDVQKQGLPFSGQPISNSINYTGRQNSFTDPGIAGLDLKNLVTKAGIQTKKYDEIMNFINDSSCFRSEIYYLN